MKTHKWDVILPEWDSFAENAFGEPVKPPSAKFNLIKARW